MGSVLPVVGCALPVVGVYLTRGACALPGGVCLSCGRGICIPTMPWEECGQNERRMWKHYLSATSFAGGKNRHRLRTNINQPLCIRFNVNGPLDDLLAALFVERIVRDVDLAHGFEDSPGLPVDLPIRLYYRSETDRSHHRYHQHCNNTFMTTVVLNYQFHCKIEQNFTLTWIYLLTQ